MRKRIAYSMNAKTTKLKDARAYAEKAFADKGMDLDKEIPNFDRNYKKLQKAIQGAKDVPRIQMPVIEPSDMALFNKRLNSGAVDIFAPYAKGKFHAPKSLSKDEGKEWISLGFQDGKKSDDVIKGKLGSTAVGTMKPTQSQIWFDKIIQTMIKYGIPKSGSKVLSQTVITSKENYILDGHHRYGQAILVDPSLKMKSLQVPLPIDTLLKVGKTYGEAIGNSAKASLSDRVASRFTGMDLTAGSSTAEKAMFTSKGSLKHLASDIVQVRTELREQGNDREADDFYLDANKALRELQKVFEKAAKMY